MPTAKVKICVSMDKKASASGSPQTSYRGITPGLH